MLDSEECEVKMTSGHKISFSIIDILDPNKFNSRRVNELARIRVPNAEGTSLEADTGASRDFSSGTRAGD